LIVRDADLDIEATDFSNTDLPYTESKTEVAIDRVTAKAKRLTNKSI
jgi:CRISPR-associated protein Csm3